MNDKLFEYEPYHPYVDLSDINFKEDSINNNKNLVEEMMYGFGDNIPSIPQTVNVMDNIVKDYLQTVVLYKKSKQINRVFDVVETKGDNAKLDIESFFYAIRKDKDKFDRAADLFLKNNDIENSKNESNI